MDEACKAAIQADDSVATPEEASMFRAGFEAGWKAREGQLVEVWLVGYDSGVDQSIITALDTMEAAKAVRDAWEHFFPPDNMFQNYFIQPVYVETLDEAMNVKGFDASRN